MNGIQKCRRFCINIAEEYAFILQPLLKLAIAYIAFTRINQLTGYNENLNNIFIILALALISSVLPDMVMIAVCAVFLILQCYAIHLFACIFASLMMLLIYIFLQRFSARYGLLLILTPMACQMGLAPLLPILGGLLLDPMALIPICSGTLVYGIISVVTGCAPAIHELAITDFTNVVTPLLDGFLRSTDIVLLLIIMASTFLCVYALKRLSVPFSWQIALVAGILCFACLLGIGNAFLETELSLFGMLTGLLAAFVIGEIVTFFCSNLKYSATARMQFEDDDYYYYVKAVPKVDGIHMKGGRQMPDRGKKEESVKKPARRAAAQPAKEPVFEQKESPMTAGTIDISKTMTGEPVKEPVYTPSEPDISNLEAKLEEAMRKMQEP